MPLFLSGWSPTTCDHTAPRSGSLGSNAGTSAGFGRTIELRILISRRGGGSAKCSGSRARVQPRNFFPPTPPSTTPSTSNAISSPPKRTARLQGNLDRLQTASGCRLRPNPGLLRAYFGFRPRQSGRHSLDDHNRRPRILSLRPDGPDKPVLFFEIKTKIRAEPLSGHCMQSSHIEVEKS